jgi:hypothetical protein
MQDETAVSRMRAPANRAIVQGEQAQASQAWNKVQQATQQWLENNAGPRAFPEVAAAQRVKELDALAPGDTKFAAANQAACSRRRRLGTRSASRTKSSIRCSTPIMAGRRRYSSGRRRRAIRIYTTRIRVRRACWTSR